MRERTFRRRRAGFTLVELMLVVLTMGALLASMAPSYLRSVYRARRAEAFFGLRGIYDAQVFHYAVAREYADSFDLLLFDLDGGARDADDDGVYDGPIYTYTLSSWDFGDEPNGSFRATATADLDRDDATLDIVIIETRLTVLE